ncbi:hypothetical protein [Sphingomonas hylomeconis]|uniref:Cytochrome b561 bacterial/Ni-hydrogenase domain-containing protein n=1 Tax=Sphingomonas hylomeconis TaxID=1395958 RepID=A0ABV7SPR6_9SPHN|nr:hypothetical protein [Sphingomonas hylomeconis]
MLIGFVPDSLAKMEAVRIGHRPPFPAILHIHALLMGSWLLVLMAQTTLMATARRTLHMQLGLAAFVLAPALVIAGFALIPAMDRPIADGVLHGPPAVAAQLRPVLAIVLDIMLLQLRIGIAFPLLIGIGLAVRRSRPSLHKRLMILGTATALPAATDRIQWLPSTMPGNPLTADLWPLLLIAPLFLWDLYRLGRIHHAYLLYFAVQLALAIPTHLLWGTAAWRGIALGLLRVEG